MAKPKEYYDKLHTSLAKELSLDPRVVKQLRGFNATFEGNKTEIVNKLSNKINTLKVENERIENHLKLYRDALHFIALCNDDQWLKLIN